MRVLAVDTSSDRGSVCIAEDSEVLGVVGLAGSMQHSERLFRSIEFLMNHVPFRLPAIDVFAAARGPGSFTGLRVGLAAMQGFAWANGKAGAGVSTLAATAWATGITDSLIAPVLDARRGEVYGALYRRTGDSLSEERPPVVATPEEWFGSLPESAIQFCGDGAWQYRRWIQRPDWQIWRTAPYLATSVAELALKTACGPLEPLYVRRTDAETARDRP